VTTRRKNRGHCINWLGEYWHVLALAAAALFLAVHYFPAYCLDGLNSDMVIPAIFYWDVMQGGHAADWYWGGSSFLFPDVSAHFLLHAVFGDGVRALEIASAFLFLGWMLAVIMGYWKCELPHVDVFAALALLLAAFIAWSSLPSFFHSVEHGGGYLVTLLALAYLQRAWLHGWRSPWMLTAVAVMIGLTCASDSLTLIVLVAPVIATVLWGAYRFPDRVARGCGLAITVGIAGLLGTTLGGLIFLPQLSTARYVSFDWGALVNSLRAIRHTDAGQGGLVIFLYAADLVVIIGTAAYLAGQIMPSRLRPESPPRFFILSYTFFLLSFNWAAAIVSGNYLGTWSVRYLALSLIWPLLLLAGWLSAALPWRRWMARLLAVTVTAICLALALHPPTPRLYLDQKQILEPGLAALMREEDTPIALGDYWCANITTVLSNGVTPVIQLSKYGQASDWFVNRKWYENEPKGGFRLILMQSEDPVFIRAHFGEPGRIAKIGDMAVWVYRPEDAIHFIPNFGSIGNKQSYPDDNTYRITAPGIFHQTGALEADSIVARPGRDLNGMVADGPGVPVKPGRYRAAYTYAFQVAPEKDREPIFESMLLVSGPTKILDRQSLHYAGPGTQTAVQEFTIAPDGRGLLQCHIEYRGSGIIRIDQQEITRLGD